MFLSPRSSQRSVSPMLLSPAQMSPMDVSVVKPIRAVSPMVLSPAQARVLYGRREGSSSSSPMVLSGRLPSSNARVKKPASQLNAGESLSPDCRRRLTFSDEPENVGSIEKNLAPLFQSSTCPKASFASSRLGMKGCEDAVLRSCAVPGKMFTSNLEEVQSTLGMMKIVKPKRSYRFNTREKAPPRHLSTLRQERLKLSRRSDNPFLKKRKCCGKECFHNVNPNYAFAQYKDFMQMNRVEKKLALHELLDERLGKFRFDNRIVCARFLSVGFRFSFCLQSSVKNTERARASSSVLVIRQEVQRDRKRDRIVSFLRNYADLAGEKLPMKAQIVLPTLKKLQVYEKFLEALREDRITDVPSRNYFYKVWKDNCPNIKAHRHHGFMVCGHCEFLRAQMHRHAKNVIALHMFRASMNVHMEQVSDERLGYYERQDLAIKYPEKYCSIVVDGADQQSYGLPHFEFKSKFDKGHKIKVRCVGVLEHKGKNHLHLFTMTEEFATGANHIIESIHRVLDKKKRVEKRLPEVLFVQADNCSRENKNRYIFAYLEMLVAMGVFLEVQVSFLPIGHTHSDIDQAFSTVSGALRYEEVVTMQDLLSLLSTCYGSRCSPEELTRIANLSEMFEFTGCLTKVKQFSPYRYFRFTRMAQCAEEIQLQQDRYKVLCDVKVSLRDQWKTLKVHSNSERSTSFLEFLPSLRNCPPTKTKVPSNVLDVNKCIDSAEQRLDDGVKNKLESLRALRDRIYTMRIYNFHWNLQTCFELSGDYLSNVVRAEVGGTRVVASDELEYQVGEFVAVKTESSEDDPFWIAKISSEATEGADGAVRMQIHWLIPSQSSPDLYKAMYKEATTVENGKQVPYKENIDVQSVLCNFEKLTARNCLHIRTQKAIRDALCVS